MKKILSGILMTTVCLLISTSAFADYITTASMNVDASSPNAFGWSGDYDAKINPLGGDTEIYCISDENMNGNNVEYDFYTIDNSLDSVYDGLYADLTEATWYANWFLKNGTTKNEKVSAQVAVWNAMGVASGNAGYSTATDLMTAYAAATDKDAYVSDWAIAVRPSNGGQQICWDEPSQNYLVHNPVPEPATMFLFGIGLLGIAGISRKKA